MIFLKGNFMTRLLGLLIVILNTPLLVAAEPTLPAKDKVHLFLLIGQSNMAGRGKPGDEDKKTHPRVWSLDKEQKWVPALAPIHFDKPTVAGVGPGVPFGKYLAEKQPDIHIGLIPCAFGGTSIAQWDAKGKLRTDAIARAKRAMQDGTLKGILWHQGESDMKNPKPYFDKLTALVADIRKDLDAPDVPFVVGELGLWNKGEGLMEINDAFHQLPRKVSNTAFVSSEGLKPGPDNVHFDTPSQHLFGQRYAEAYLKLSTKK